MPESIYDDLHDWSVSLQLWQRDALRRVVQSDLLSSRDAEELGHMAFSAAARQPEAASQELGNGTEPDTSSAPTAVPLDLTHLPSRSSTAPPVTLKALRHISGVNRLRPDAEIPFATHGLNVVYGFNGVGKSGFTRILKRACHSRSPEVIVTDVFSDAPQQPRAEISYKLGDEDLTHTWDLDKESTDAYLPRVAVYDNRGASIHFKRDGAQVELLPPGLNSLSRLSDLYGAVADWARLELARRRAIPTPEAHRNATSLRTQMDSLGTAGAIQALQELAFLSEQEKTELASLPVEIQVLEAGTRKERIASETFRESQFRSQAARLAAAIDTFADEQVSQLVAIVKSYSETQREALTAPKPPEELLTGVHSDHWATMWSAALNYAVLAAYPGPQYEPEIGSLCLLCQQPLNKDAVERLQRYAAQETESVAARLRRLKTAFTDIAKGMSASTADGTLDGALLAVLPNAADSMVPIATSALAAAAQLANRLASTVEPAIDPRDEAVLRAVVAPLTKLHSTLLVAADRGKVIVEQLSAESDDPERINAARSRLRLLEERTALQQNMDGLVALHKALGDIDTLNAVVAQCNTSALSRKSSAMSTAYVTDICEGFSKEAALLGGFDISASMAPLTTQRGVRRTGIVLRQAKQTSVAAESVLSEGELRVMSLAAFFADLRGSGDSSAIALDDPMTSLDHRFQQRIAERLVHEARTRQVVVFTHSTAFLSALQTAVEDDPTAQINEGFVPPEPVPLSVIEITRDRNSGLAGIKVESFLTATNIIELRVKHLRELRDASKAFWESGDSSGYERSIENFARHLRGTWESAVEDLLLCKVVRRNRNSVTTENRIAGIIGITPAEVATVAHGMDVESFFVHSTPEGSEKDSPKPEELDQRVQALTDWIAIVKARQKDVKARYPV